MRIRIYVWIILLGLVAGACNRYGRALSREKSMLSRVAASSLKTDQKLDSLLASGIRVMDLALKPINPVKGGKMVARYYEDNQAAMERIMGQVNADFTRMNLLDQGLFIANVATKPSVRQFATLYPRFQKKYKQVQAASKFVGFFSNSFGKLGKLATLILGGGAQN